MNVIPPPLPEDESLEKMIENVNKDINFKMKQIIAKDVQFRNRFVVIWASVVFVLFSFAIYLFLFSGGHRYLMLDYLQQKYNSDVIKINRYLETPGHLNNVPVIAIDCEWNRHIFADQWSPGRGRFYFVNGKIYSDETTDLGGWRQNVDYEHGSLVYRSHLVTDEENKNN